MTSFPIAVIGLSAFGVSGRLPPPLPPVPPPPPTAAAAGPFVAAAFLPQGLEGLTTRLSPGIGEKAPEEAAAGAVAAETPLWAESGVPGRGGAFDLRCFASEFEVPCK